MHVLNIFFIMAVLYSDFTDLFIIVFPFVDVRRLLLDHIQPSRDVPFIKLATIVRLGTTLLF